MAQRGRHQVQERRPVRWEPKMCTECKKHPAVLVSDLDFDDPVFCDQCGTACGDCCGFYYYRDEPLIRALWDMRNSESI